MFDIWKKRKNFIRSDRANEAETTPYDQKNEVHSMVMLVTIINRNQSSFYIDAYEKCGASMTMVLYAHSMPPEEYRNILGIDSTKKEILLTFCRAEDSEKMLEIAKERFCISKAAKGIAFTCPLDGIDGVASYLFLADQDRELRERNHGKQSKEI